MMCLDLAIESPPEKNVDFWRESTLCLHHRNGVVGDIHWIRKGLIKNLWNIYMGLSENG